MNPAVIGAIDMSHDGDATPRLEGAALARVQAVCNFVNAETSRQRNILIGIAIACVLGAMLLPVLTGLHDPRVLFVLVVGAIGFFFARARADLASAYQKVAVNRLVNAVGGGLSYRARSTLARDQFLVSDLFNGVKRWQSRDEIGGRTRDTRYTVHRVRASDAERGAPVFDGLIVRIEGGTPFPGHTVVVSEGSPLPVGSRVRRDLVLLKNPAFEERFNVFATDYHEARRLLTARLMAAIMDAADRLDGDIRLAFTQKSAFLAIPGGDALRVRASLFGAAVTPDAIVGRLVTLVAAIDGIAGAIGGGERSYS